MINKAKDTNAMILWISVWILTVFSMVSIIGVFIDTEIFKEAWFVILGGCSGLVVAANVAYKLDCFR